MSKGDKEYKEWLQNSQVKWESLCGRCGACCGSVEDPCENLAKDDNGQYYCVDYKNRFGKHKTVGGHTIRCVPIRKILHLSWPGDECCGYKKALKSS